MLNGTFIADQLRKGFDSDPWHGPATADLLRDLPAELAAAHPVDTAHSIWEIVLHMTAWQREVLRRIGGELASMPSDGDWPAAPSATPAAWSQACTDLGASLDRVVRAAADQGADDLNRPVGAVRDRQLGTGVTCAEMLQGLLQHNAYHSGQIALLRRALGL